jgi:DNA-binding transcriptional LysR family regulator
MTLEQLRIFLAVAKHLHFTRAAEELYITQPAVSAAINSLEKEYGVKLFHRVGRHIEITEAGQLLEIEAQKILDQVLSTERGLRELNSMQRGELRLGSSLTLGNYWLPDRISRFKQQFPGITVNCSLANAEEIADGTVSGSCDIGLITGSVKPSLRSILRQEVVGSDRLQIVVGKLHPWYKRVSILAEELITTTWIMREPGSAIQQVFEENLNRIGIDPIQLDVDLILTSSEMVKSVVEQSKSAAAVSELMLKKELQLGTLRTVKVVHQQHNGCSDMLDMIQPVLMLMHRERFQSRVAIAFEQLLLKPVYQRDEVAGSPTLC